jgi:hypothetical protein
MHGEHRGCILAVENAATEMSTMVPHKRVQIEDVKSQKKKVAQLVIIEVKESLDSPTVTTVRPVVTDPVSRSRSRSH